MNNYNEEHPQMQLIDFIGKISKNYGQLVAIISNIEQAITNTTPKLRDIDSINNQISDLKIMIGEQRNSLSEMLKNLDTHQNHSGEALSKLLSLTEIMEKVVLDLKERSDIINKDDIYMRHIKNSDSILEFVTKLENLMYAWNLTIKENEVFVDDKRIGISDIKNTMIAVDRINNTFLFIKEKKTVVISIIGFLLLYVKSGFLVDKLEFILSHILLWLK